MNIAEVTHVFYPQGIGDPFNAYSYSLQHVAKGHNFTVITWNKSDSSLEREKGNVTVYRLPGINLSRIGIRTDYPYLPTLPSLLRSLEFDVLHANSHLFLTTVSAIMEAKRMRKPAVLTVHGVTAARGFKVNMLQQIYLRTIGTWIFKNASRIICLTKSDAVEVIKYGCEPKKIRIIPNAIDTDIFSPNAENEVDGLITWVGRFVPEKGLKHLILAAIIVCAKHKNIKFHLIGDGPLKISLINLVKKCHMEDKILFRGVMNKKQIAHALTQSSIFILPSLSEGLPVSLLEAMSCAKPAIASNIPGVNDLIMDYQNGILVPPRDSEAIANAIILLVNNKMLRSGCGT